MSLAYPFGADAIGRNIKNWFARTGGEQLTMLSVVFLLAVLLLPIMAIVWLSLSPAENIWPHLWANVLPSAIADTIYLMVGVGAITLIVGTGTAWLVTMYQFPGRNIVDWLLVLPLAMPTYIIAFCYVELFDYSGNLQSGLRALFGWQSARDYWFPQIRSTEGAIFVMSFVLYPYVYLSARASFLQQSICVLEVARTLGHSSWGVFRAVALPLARPALMAGVALGLMECLNDIGAVEYLGVNSLTIAVYTTWLDRSNLGGASQLASVMLIFVILLFTVERLARGRQKYHHTTGRYQPIPYVELGGVRGWLATIACTLPFLLGVALPAVVLLDGVFRFGRSSLDAALLWSVWHSFLIAGLAASIAVSLALYLSYGRRVLPNLFMRIATRLAGFGYAVPGTVLAVGLLIPLAAFDNSIDGFMRNSFGISTGLILSGTIFAVVLALAIRFMAVSVGAVEAGFDRISPNLDAAARTLGETSTSTLIRIHLPMLRPALGAAALLVFVDSMKELPATLLLRPFNFDTLATHVYGLASLDQFEEASLAAMLIVLIGLAPVLLLHRAIASGRVGGVSHERKPGIR